MEKIEPLDETILAEMTADEGSTDDEIVKERLKADVTQRLAAIDEKLERALSLPFNNRHHHSNTLVQATVSFTHPSRRFQFHNSQ